MSFQDNQGAVDTQVGHETPGADDGAQVVQTPVQIAQIVSNGVSQALTHQTQQLREKVRTVVSETFLQQVQTPIKYDVPAFEGENTASWLTWSQRVIYQARACGFEDELIAPEGEGLSVGADVFDNSSVDPLRLRNAHAAWMVLINRCRGMALEIVQRS